MKTYVLDFDDFSVLNNRLDLLLKLRESYPNLKVSMFMIPYDYVYERDVAARLLRDKTLEAIKQNLDWIELIPHGLTHIPGEFAKCDYKTMKDYVIPAIDECFKRDNLPYVKGFKAPNWLWNKEVVRALDDAGWWGAIDMVERHDKLKTKKYFEYTHSIESFYFRSTLDVIKLHGHITANNRNSIEKCFTNLFKMEPDAKFKFASEMLDERSDVGK